MKFLLLLLTAAALMALSTSCTSSYSGSHHTSTSFPVGGT